MTVLFGGQYSGWTLADTWEYDGSNWVQRSTGGPPHRINHAMAFDEARGEVVLFGGMGIRNSNDAHYKDTWVWDGTVWREHFAVPGPVELQWHSMAYDAVRGVTILYGGRSMVQSGTFDDTWEWDGGSWTRVTTQGIPRFASNCRMSFDSTRGVAVLLGYESKSGDCSTWEYLNRPGPTASIRTFGQACAGSAGMPSLGQIGGSLPKIGTSFRMLLASLPTSGLASVRGLIGASKTQWGANLLPLDLSFIGMTSCTLYVSVDSTGGSLSTTSGVASWFMAIPNSAALAGGTVYLQGLVLEPGVNRFGAILTNAAELRIGY